MPAASQANLIDCYRNPQPRLLEGRALAEIGAHAMIDISDGLATDAWRIAQASGVTINLDGSHLPIEPETAHVANQLGISATQLAATGGEDFELCFCISPSHRELVEKTLSNTKVTWIGEVTKGSPKLNWQNAPAGAENWRGWDNFP
jgi:thiamine-monophosphate kinase